MTRGRTAAITIAIIAVMVITAIVSAHTPSASLTCEGGLRVDLTKYQGRKANHVTIVLDGIVLEDQDFYGTYHLTGYGDLDPYVSHIASVEVRAWDDPHAEKGWSFSDYFELKPCQESPTPSPTPEVTPSPTPAPSASPGATPAPRGTSRPTLPPTDTE